MLGGGEAFGIVRNFAPVGFIRFDVRKTKQCHRDIVRALFTNPRKTEYRRGRDVIGHEIAMMSASVFFDQTHPHSRVMLKLRQLVRINRVA